VVLVADNDPKFWDKWWLRSVIVKATEDKLPLLVPNDAKTTSELVIEAQSYLESS
jgi:hypothetical protein